VKLLHSHAGIKLFHLATQPFSVSECDDLPVSRYVDLVCKIPYNVIIEKYLQARKNYGEVQYRAAYSQIHQQEINHMIIVCCKGDKELEKFPVLG